MGRELPILFNTDMVRAILDGRKTVTRRVIRYKYSNTEMKVHTDKYGTRLIEIQKDIEGETHGKNSDGSTWHKLLPYIDKNPPYRKGDILYVRETWAQVIDIPHWQEYHRENSYLPIIPHEYVYKADNVTVNGILPEIKWHPSIHMPKKAARIWLKITDVRVERLNDISGQGVLKEGINSHVHSEADYFDGNQKEMFAKLWNSTIKKSDRAIYGWDANPWVWVIEFERCEKPEY